MRTWLVILALLLPLGASAESSVPDEPRRITLFRTEEPDKPAESDPTARQITAKMLIKDRFVVDRKVGFRFNLFEFKAGSGLGTEIYFVGPFHNKKAFFGLRWDF